MKPNFDEINWISTASNDELEEKINEYFEEVEDDIKLRAEGTMKISQEIVNELPEDFIEQLYSWKPNNLINRTGLYNDDYSPNKYRGIYYVRWSEFEKYMIDEWYDSDKLPKFNDFCNDNTLIDYRNDEGEVGENMDEFWYFFVIFFLKRFKKIRFIYGSNPVIEQDDWLTLVFA